MVLTMLQPLERIAITTSSLLIYAKATSTQGHCLMMIVGLVFVMIKLDKAALKESMADTFMGTAINLPLVWVVLTICLVFTQNAFIISLAQAGVLTVVAIIRRYCTRMWFKNKEETNVAN